MHYKHTQFSYLMLIITLAILVFFIWMYITASAEPVSADSGTNLAITSIMTLIVATLASFISLQVSVDKIYLKIKFGYGIYSKKFPIHNIISAKTVKNHRYYGRGIRIWLLPKMRIFNNSGFDAVEIKLKNGKIYRIGTNDPKNLEQAILHSIK